MGGPQSREDLEISDSEEDADEQSQEEDDTEDEGEEQRCSGRRRSLDDVETKLKYPSNNPNVVKLYLHVGGSTPESNWIISDKIISYSFVKASEIAGSDEDEDGEEEAEDSCWILKIGSKVRAKVSTDLQLKSFGDQRRVDLASQSIWAIKFDSDEDYNVFLTKYQECLFENTYGYESNEANLLKVYGEDFIGWAKPEAADDSVWEDADKGKGFM